MLMVETETVVHVGSRIEWPAKWVTISSAVYWIKGYTVNCQWQKFSSHWSKFQNQCSQQSNHSNELVKILTCSCSC